uniref:Ig-like domain-containing protein n=1 Tax=Amphimedon queenslandica TaxID=400682 RepID=A0A1X7VNT3_AMPQE
MILLLLSLVVQSSLQYQVKPFTSLINGITCISDPCKLYDDVTNEGLAFNPDKFVGYGLPHIWMYIYYPTPKHGVHLTFINNYKVSQSDDDTIMLSMIVLNAKPYNNTAKEIPLLELFSPTTSDFATQKTFISEIKFFIDTEPISFSALPIVFMSPNQTLEPDTVQPSLNLSCTVVNNGTFHWTWSGPGVSISNGVMKLADTTRTSILMLSNVSAADAGDYTCSASYLAMGNNSWGVINPNTNTSKISLTLFSSVSATANTVIIEEGKDVTLSCIFTGYLPINYEISWTDSRGMKSSDGIIANGDNTQFMSQRGSPSTSPAVQSNLTIASVKETDSGLYTCTMSGTGSRDTILLIVFRLVTQIELEPWNINRKARS